MRLENQQSTIVWRVAGLLACAVALTITIATGGAALIPGLLLLATGGHYAWRSWVEAVVLSTHFRTLTVTRTRMFATSTRTFPLDGLTAHYQVQGGLRSAKYHILEFRYQGRTIADLDPKQGYDRAGIEAFHAALLATQAADAAPTTSASASQT